MATAHFVMNRENESKRTTAFMLETLDCGVMLTYSATFR